MTHDQPAIVVVGSVNLDFVATADRLPAPGETVTGAVLNRFPGGKGANQALAARRLGARVSLVACVGDDPEADAALALLNEGDVDLAASVTHPSAPTGVALIAVSPDGENHIVVAPGANRELSASHIALPEAEGLICQLEVELPALEHAINAFDGFICINLAPAADVPDVFFREAELLVVNESEARFYSDALLTSDAMVARTLGADGAELLMRGKVISRAEAPVVETVDTTGAGDTFTAALTLALIEGQAPEQALRFACAAGAAATTKPGAQPSLPLRADVEQLLLSK